MNESSPFSKVPEERTAEDNILRVNHGNQMRLGLMADAKANIMITVASIVFSVTIANLDNDLMKWPLLTFAFGCFFSLLFAIFAIIPKIEELSSGINLPINLLASSKLDSETESLEPKSLDSGTIDC